MMIIRPFGCSVSGLFSVAGPARVEGLLIIRGAGGERVRLAEGLGVRQATEAASAEPPGRERGAQAPQTTPRQPRVRSIQSR